MRQNNIKVLSDIEHVLNKPGMYLGSTTNGSHCRWHLTATDHLSKNDIIYNPGFLKLFDEIISNSIDEALRTDFKYANKIDVNVDGSVISVEDNGRGIPVINSDQFPDKTQAELAFVNLRAGSNFGNEKVISIGTHGLGATLVNIMSSVFRAETDDGKNRLKLLCTDNMSKINAKVFKSNGKPGTFVEYTTDFTRFTGLNEIDSTHLSFIKKRVIDLACAYPEIKFTFNKQQIKTKSFKNYLQMITTEENFVGMESDDWRIAVIASEESDQISFVNGIDTYEGGTHVEVVRNKIVNALVDDINKKYKKLDIKPADIKNKLTFVVFTNKIKSPKFRSQTKEYISNAPGEFEGLFDGVDDDGFIKKILKNENIILPIIETKKLKLEAEERIALKKANKAATKKVKIAAHISANSSNWKHKTLFITEGASAIGQLCKVRNPDIHGGFPLRGKPMNVYGEKATTIVHNEELHNLMSIIGLQIGETYDDLNYGTIAIMSDADYDGISIRGLLINFFSIWPQLFNEGRIKIVKSPIVIVEDKKDSVVHRFYSLDDYDAKKFENGQRYKVNYLKGLGSLREDEYELMIQKPILETVKLDDAWKSSIDLAFGNSADLRKEWLSHE